MISVARVGGGLNDLRAKLGNDVAITAYREGTLPLPARTIIARLAWVQAPSEEDNKALAPLLEQRMGADAAHNLLADSFVAGPPANVQFMVKDSERYASTGGWGFAQFNDGKPADKMVHKTCFACHEPAGERDFVLTVTHLDDLSMWKEESRGVRDAQREQGMGGAVREDRGPAHESPRARAGS